MSRPSTKILLSILCVLCISASLREASHAADFHKEIEPVLIDYCFDCHGDGSAKGDLALDEYENLEEHLANRDMWLAVWKNLRAQLMPPSDKKQPGNDQRHLLTNWIQREIFKVDPENPDPGRVTIRRLNRAEYENTIRDLVGIQFDAETAFPADDTGYGFDNIGDVLSLSPLLMEKYIAAAEEIVGKAVHTEGPFIPTHTAWGSHFKNEQGRHPRDVPFEKPDTFKANYKTDHPGEYEVRAAVRVKGSDDATNHSVRFTLLNGDKKILSRDLGWDFNKEILLRGKTTLVKGDNLLVITLEETEPPGKDERTLDLYTHSIDLRGPLDGSVKVYPEKYHRIFTDGPPSNDPKARDAYARKIIKPFTERAYRQPVADDTLDKLVAIARTVDAQPNRSFEDGIAQAFIAVLASPRFLFRTEIQPPPANPGKVVPVNEFALASRLSYFLWSSMPDKELFRLAHDEKLRANLRPQIDRMLKDEKSRALIENFAGQWLLTRNVETIDIDPRPVTGEKELDKAFRIFSSDLRRSMRQETEMLVAHLFQENRPAHELLNADYSFLNENLAVWYGIPAVKGSEMRLVKLPPDSHRGGLLTHASLHLVTSNPTRTSPVKRGLFVVDNILGTPSPPPPGDIPELEEAKKKAGQNPSKRELMAIHAEKALCKSCHARFDPLGLALENYDLGGRWRNDDNGAPIDPSGQLITGETFKDLEELIRILTTGNRRRDFYRSLTEKLYTYALGRGTEYYDIGVIDRIVAATEEDGGKIRTIIYQIAESPAFQKRRSNDTPASPNQ